MVKTCIFILLFCISICCSNMALAKPITLRWNHNDTAAIENKDMIGYNLYRTTDIRRGKGYYVGAVSIATIPVGTNRTTVELPDVDCNFVLTAYNAKAESGLSAEAVYTAIRPPTPVLKPAIPTGLQLVK
jgi:hypothetical protein